MLRAFEIPETRSEQIRWLETEMLGSHFLEIVAELNAVHPFVSASPFQLTQAESVAVCQQGLSALAPPRFAQLLSDPNGLLAVQQTVLVNGDLYWSRTANERLPAPPTLAANVTHLQNEHQPTTDTAQPNTLANLQQKRSAWPGHLAAAALASLATAAMMWLMLKTPNNAQPNSLPQNDIVKLAPAAPVQPDVTNEKPTWGFAKFAAQQTSAASSEPITRETYLRDLASAAEAWSNKRPQTPAELAVRLSEFRLGCSAILLAKHEPLSAADQTWLFERCQSWAAAIDDQLASLESGADVEQVIIEMDSIVTKISAALAGRADTQS